MTAAQLRAALTRLKLSQHAAARLLECDRTELAVWVRGDAPVPTTVGILLHLLADGTISSANIASAKINLVKPIRSRPIRRRRMTPRSPAAY